LLQILVNLHLVSQGGDGGEKKKGRGRGTHRKEFWKVMGGGKGKKTRKEIEFQKKGRATEGALPFSIYQCEGKTAKNARKSCKGVVARGGPSRRSMPSKEV